VAVAVLPAASVAVHVTVVKPIGNVAGALFATVAPVQLSENIGIPNTTEVASQFPESTGTVIATGAVITGFSLSSIVTVCVAVAVFPAASVAVQVTVVVPTGNVAGALFATVVPVQLSENTGVPNATVAASHAPASADCVIATGAVITGFCVSSTVTVCVAVEVFPAASVAVQVTLVIPIGNVAGASFATVAPVQLSENIGDPKTTAVAVHAAKSAGTVIATGAVITGFWVSSTVTVCVAVAVFPAASVAVHVTVVKPIGNIAGASFATVAPVQLSANIGVPKTTALAVHAATSAGTVIATGAVIVGFWLS
jgi:hypothetical protein